MAIEQKTAVLGSFTTFPLLSIKLMLSPTHCIYFNTFRFLDIEKVNHFISGYTEKFKALDINDLKKVALTSSLSRKDGTATSLITLTNINLPAKSAP